MSLFLSDCAHEFRRHKMLVDQAMASLDDALFFRKPAEKSNSVAIIIKHLAGSARSRWTNFLSTDGEKPDRNRDGEFEITPADDRHSLMAAWEKAWAILLGTISSLTDTDLGHTVTIRGEPHRVQQAVLRGLDHVAYHTGQILYLCRLLAPDAPYLTIAPGATKSHPSNYLRTGS